MTNQKGGVGKTSTTVNMAAALAQQGQIALVIDIDPQGNASTALGIDHGPDVDGVYDVLIERHPMMRIVRECPDVANLWCAPATIDLAGAELELVAVDQRETRLTDALERLLTHLAKAGIPGPDVVLIDCPPSLGLLTLNALVAADEVLIPLQCEYYALEGLTALIRTVSLVQGGLNPRLHVGGILLTMYDARTNLAAQVAEEVRTHFPGAVLRQTIPRSVRVSEAPSFGQTVMTYDPTGTGALSYWAAAREWAARTNRKEAQ